MLKAENIVKSYGDTKVLKGVNLRVKKGRMRVITGRSGTGKSTLLNVLSGLDEADDGSLYLGGVDAANAGRKTMDNLRRNTIGFIFQSYNLISGKTALENVMLPLAYGGVGYFRRRNAALSALDRVGLSGKAYNLPRQLSGGQQQRVAVARAIVTRPGILFCDEPTGNLDRESRDAVLKEIIALKNGGSAVIMITHDPTIPALADDAFVLEDGKLKRI